MPRLTALYRYWGKHPPVHLLVAGYVGYKPKETPKEAMGDLGELIAIFEGGKIK